MKNRFVLLFSQSPRDIEYILSIIDGYESKQVAFEVIATCKETFNFFSSVDFLDYDVCVSGYYGKFKSRIGKVLYYYFFILCSLRSLNKRYKSYTELECVYFFSNSFDILTLGYYLENCNRFCFKFIDVFGMEQVVSSSTGLDVLVKKGLVNIFISKEISYSTLDVDEFFIEKEKLKGVNYSYSINKNAVLLKANKFRPEALQGKSVIFYDHFEGASDILKIKFQILDDIFQLLFKEGYSIYVKEHPRLGGNSLKYRYSRVNLIPMGIPAELIDRTNFSFEISFASAALGSTPSCSTSISLIKLLEVKSGQDFSRIRENMRLLPLVKLVENMVEFKELL